MTERDRILLAARMAAARRAEVMYGHKVTSHFNWETVLMVLVGPDRALAELNPEQLRAELGMFADQSADDLLDGVRQDIKKYFRKPQQPEWIDDPSPIV